MRENSPVALRAATTVQKFNITDRAWIEHSEQSRIRSGMGGRVGIVSKQVNKRTFGRKMQIITRKGYPFLGFPVSLGFPFIVFHYAMFRPFALFEGKVECNLPYLLTI